MMTNQLSDAVYLVKSFWFIYCPMCIPHVAIMTIRTAFSTMANDSSDVVDVAITTNGTFYLSLLPALLGGRKEFFSLSLLSNKL